MIVTTVNGGDPKLYVEDQKNQILPSAAMLAAKDARIADLEKWLSEANTKLQAVLQAHPTTAATAASNDARVTEVMGITDKFAGLMAEKGIKHLEYKNDNKGIAESWSITMLDRPVHTGPFPSRGWDATPPANEDTPELRKAAHEREEERVLFAAVRGDE